MTSLTYVKDYDKKGNWTELIYIVKDTDHSVQRSYLIKFPTRPNNVKIKKGRNYEHRTHEVQGLWSLF